jgi:hypothetical protein
MDRVFSLFRRIEMPRFHSEIADGFTVPDPSGLELPTEQAAKKVAHEIAKQISIDVDGQRLKDVVVKTEDGRELYKAPIKSE